MTHSTDRGAVTRNTKLRVSVASLAAAQPSIVYLRDSDVVRVTDATAVNSSASEESEDEEATVSLPNFEDQLCGFLIQSAISFTVSFSKLMNPCQCFASHASPSGCDPPSIMMNFLTGADFK